MPRPYLPFLLNALASLAGNSLLPGCAGHLARSEGMRDDAEPISLRLASAFDDKFGKLCIDDFERPLLLEHMGPLGHAWVDGVKVPAGYYNLWWVTVYRSAATGTLEVPQPRKLEFLIAESKGEIVGEHLFSLRLGRFQKHRSVIHVKMGQFEFDVGVHNIVGGRSVDDVIPVLGTSIREFVGQLEKANDLDEYFGIGVSLRREEDWLYERTP